MTQVEVYPGGRVVIGNFSLKSLIMLAFNLNYWQISGGDDRVGSQAYDVGAKPGVTSQSATLNLRHSLFHIEDEHLRQMLQALLIDRFQLKFHCEIRTGPVYLLIRSSKSVPLLPTQATSDSEEHPFGGEGFSGDIGRAGGEWVIYNTSMPQMAKFASDLLHRPVLDQTQLAGSLDFRWPMISAGSDPQNDDFADSFRLLVEEAGLKLKPATGPVETFVIDHAQMSSPD